MNTSFGVNYKDFENLEQAVKDYQGDSEQKLNEYLHGRGYSTFEKAIRNGIPVSGRKWKGKKKAAKTAKSLQDKDKDENLAVTVRAATAYNYLYFPNDGSNTIHHYGNQRFFEAGVEKETEHAVNDMLDLLKFNGD
ncbi:MAG: hypothetical protein HFJ06_03185 [Lachnospiraceae bacterium]|nr:hypothetical protein [Lachnospiraceae bacterium]